MTVSTEQLQDFLHNVKSPCEIAPTKSSEEPKGSEELEDKETIHKMEGFFQDKGHDCQQLTKNHFGINRSPLIICTSELTDNICLSFVCMLLLASMKKESQ